MTARDDLESRYLRALSRLNPSLGHEARGQLGHVTIQIDLMREILKRSDPGDPETHARLELAAEKARNAARDVEASIERILTATRAPSGDLGQSLRTVAGLVSPMLQDVGGSLELELPPEPVWMEGDHDRLRRALLVAAVEAAGAVEPGGRLTLRLEAEGRITVKGASGESWLAALRDTLEDIGIVVDGRSARDGVALRLPVQSGAR